MFWLTQYIGINNPTWYSNFPFHFTSDELKWNVPDNLTTVAPSISELDFNSYEMKIVASTSTEIINYGVNSPGAVVYTAAITDNLTQGRHRPLQLKPEKPTKMLTNGNTHIEKKTGSI